MSDYVPTIDASKTLTEIVPSMLQGLSHTSCRKHFMTYNNIRMVKADLDVSRVVNVICDISIRKADDEGSEESIKVDCWVASIPEPHPNGTFLILGKRYYTTMRQRIVSNVPICTMRYVKGRPVIECTMRSENMETLESVYVTVKRSHMSPYNLIMQPHIKGAGETDAASLVRLYTGEVHNWKDIMMVTCRLLGAPDTILSLICREGDSYEEVSVSRCYFPSTLDPNTRKQHYIQVGDAQLSSECICLCSMMVKYLSVECGLSQPDDQDDYSNKIVDTYANLICRLLRKKIRSLGPSIAYNAIEGTPKIVTSMLEAFTRNLWEVIESKDTDLKISRLVSLSNSLGISELNREVIIYASSKHGLAYNPENYTRRLLHPSQSGFVCKIRTSDDINAGLKSYLAADCRISTSCNLEGVDGDNNLFLRKSYYDLFERTHERDVTPDYHADVSAGDRVIWLHNHRVVAIPHRDVVTTLLHRLKLLDPHLDWTMSNNVLESRCYYGRLMKIVHTQAGNVTLVDTRSTCGLIHIDASLYSSVCNEIPLFNMMPVPRLILSTKIVQKSISYEQELSTKEQSVHLAYGQRPLVTTVKWSTLIYGSNVYVCYTTMRGLGIEDGIILSKSSIERGMFSVVQRVCIEWTKEESMRVRSYSVNVSKCSEVKEGSVLAMLICVRGDGNEVIQKLVHDKPYVAHVEDVYLTFNDSKAAPASLECISVVLIRYKRLNTGDKLSSRYGQKAVVAKVVPEEDMPQVENPNYPRCPDMMVNPLSILSRGTMCQEVSSALGLEVLIRGGIIAKDSPFNGVYIGSTDKHSKLPFVSPVDISSIQCATTCLISGTTGETYDCEAKVGFEYYMALDHLADVKVRSAGPSKRNDMTGSIQSQGSSASIRYNWQELSALLHGRHYSILSDIYNGVGVRGFYPYCSTCKRDVDAQTNNACEHCGKQVEDKVLVAKPLMTVKRLVQVLGIDIKIGSEEQ